MTLEGLCQSSFDSLSRNKTRNFFILAISFLNIALTSCKESVSFDQSLLLSSDSPPASEAAPPAPINLVIDVTSSTSLLLSWSSGGGTTTSYRIAYQLGVDPPSDCHSGTLVDSSSTSKLLTGLTTGKVYGLRICSLNQSEVFDSSGGVTSSSTPSSYRLI